MGRIDEARCDGAHLFLMHGKDSEWRTFKELGERSYRAVWLPADVCRQYGKSAVRADPERHAVLRGAVARQHKAKFELAAAVAGRRLSSGKAASEAWKRARTVHAGRDDLRDVANVVARFREAHRHQGHWIDERRLMYRHGTHHAIHVSDWRKRKLTFDIPAGFHFDVQHERSRPFTLRARGRLARLRPVHECRPARICSWRQLANVAARRLVLVLGTSGGLFPALRSAWMPITAALWG